MLIVGSVFILGTLAGREFLASTLGKNVTGVVFIVAGFFAGIAPAMLMRSFQKVDRQPPDEFSRFYSDRFEERLSRARSDFWFQYFVAIGFALVSLAAGWVLRLNDSVPSIEWFIGVGAGSSLVGTILAFLAIAEFKVISDTVRDIDNKARLIRRRRKLHKAE